MRTRILTILPLIFFLLLFIACKREYSYEGGLGAVYSFVGSPNACTNAIINGNFSAGITTDSGNTVQLTVAVTQTGTYNISTGVVDGIQFSSAGNFQDTGMQQMILYAAGTPDTSGSFAVAIPGTGGCQFTITVTPKQPAVYQLSGAPDDCTKPDIAGQYTAGANMVDLNKLTVSVNVLSTGAYTIATDTVNGVYFAASGYFSTTGNQQVTLQSSGTPKLPGLYYIHLQGNSSACNFYLPVQSIEPLAYYVLQSSVLDDTLICTPSSVQGIYITNSPVMHSNTATISIYVAQPGNYTIATDRVNGVLFQYSGMFTVNGAQDVVLFAEGTPLAAGTFLYTAQIVGPATLGGSSCSFKIPVQ